MMDTLTPSERSARMRLIRGKDTKPEYRLHRVDLPGKPDMAFIGRGATRGVISPCARYFRIVLRSKPVKPLMALMDRP